MDTDGEVNADGLLLSRNYTSWPVDYGSWLKLEKYAN
jgi:hypothetical protein